MNGAGFDNDFGSSDLHLNIVPNDSSDDNIDDDSLSDIERGKMNQDEKTRSVGSLSQSVGGHTSGYSSGGPEENDPSSSMFEDVPCCTEGSGRAPLHQDVVPTSDESGSSMLPRLPRQKRSFDSPESEDFRFKENLRGSSAEQTDPTSPSSNLETTMHEEVSRQDVVNPFVNQSVNHAGANLISERRSSCSNLDKVAQKHAMGDKFEAFDMVSLSSHGSADAGHVNLRGETEFHTKNAHPATISPNNHLGSFDPEERQPRSGNGEAVYMNALSIFKAQDEEKGEAGLWRSETSTNTTDGPDDKDDGVDEGQAKVKVDAPTTEPVLTPLRQVFSLWYMAVIFLTPVLLLPLPLVINTQEAKCAYVIFVMAVFWVTEAIPIAMTSLMPVFLLPMMGVLTARTVSATYLNDTSILFMGGLTVAIAIETWNLHRRIALSVMLVAGAEPRWLMLGMMLVTWFLSMWMSNTATTAMMLPIVQAVLEQIQDTQDIDASEDDHSHDVPVVSELEKKAEEDDDNERGTSSQKKKKKKSKAEQKTESKGKAKPKQLSMTELGKALSLAIAYSANVGGIGSLTGTGPNLVLLGQSQIIFEQYGLQTPITFASWLVFGLPLSLMLVFIVWIWLQVLFFRCRGGCDCIFKRGSKDLEERNQKVRAAIRKEFEKLGPITFAQGTIMVFFGILVALWITRDLGGSGGWGLIFEEGFVSDSTPAVLTAVLFFVLPSSLPDILFPSKRHAKGPRGPIKPLLDWRTLNEKMPWSLYLLLGGGFAIAQAAETSGLSRWLGQKLAVFGALDPWLMLLIICYIVTFATEVTSNTAIATLMMPILAQLALTLEVNPLFFMFPTAITTSFAFMLPVATPPNAIVFAFGTVRVIDMVTCGFILNILCVPCLLLATVTWANAFFHFTTLPPEFLLNANISAPANHSAGF